jgi:cob(I)alamin adenosyltransferase
MKIYTRTGDRGETGLLGGQRVSKSSLRVAAYGEVDELSAVLGLAASQLVEPAAGDGRWQTLRDRLATLQHTLFSVGAELAQAPEARQASAALLDEQAVAALESSIDVMSETLSPLRHFILPGGSPAGSTLHLARTVCRRAERAVVALAEQESVRELLLAYLNRLSDSLFVMARLANAMAGSPEPIWTGGRSAGGGAAGGGAAGATNGGGAAADGTPA